MLAELMVASALGVGPVAGVEQAFARHGYRLRTVASSTELCDLRAGACSGLDVWGGRAVFLATGGEPKFELVVSAAASDAARLVPLFGRNRVVVAVRRGRVVLLYLRSLPKAQARGLAEALAEIPG